MESSDFAVLDKLIRLNAQAPAAVNEIYKIAITAEDCKGILRANESVAGKEAGDSPAGTAQLADPELARMISSSPPVCASFLGQPLLSQVEPATLAVLASIADIRPNDKGVPVTRDSSLAYVAALVLNEAGTTSKDGLMQAFVRRLVNVNAKFPRLIDVLRESAAKEDYRDLVKGFDSWLDQYAAAATEPKFPSEAVERLVAACGHTMRSQAERGLLYESPRLSQIPREFMRSFPPQRPEGAEAATGPSTESLILRHRQTQDAFDAMQETNGAELERTVQIRLDAAKEFLSRRQFAKAQMLEFGWPQLAARVRAAKGMRRLRNLEKAVLEPGRTYKFDPYWRRLLNDERLVDFLTIPPYFIDILTEEFAGITEEFSGIPDGEQSPTGDESGTSTAEGDRIEFSEYNDIELIFSPVANGNPKELENVRAAFTLKVADKIAQAEIVVPARRIRQGLAMLEHAYNVSYNQSQGSRSLGGQPARRDISASFPPPDDVLEDIGNELWAALMTAEGTEGVRHLFNSAVTDNEHLRIIFTNNTQPLADMPWECLYIPDLRVFAGLTLKTSVVRHIPDPVSLVPRSMGHPFRILIVSSTPANLPWINAEQEVSVLQRALSPAERAGLVRLEVLVNPDEEELQHRLRLVRPHIFHFVGHGAVQADGEGVVALTGRDDKAIFVTASRFGTMLRDHGILLSTLNSCFSGGETDFDMARSIARILVRHGVPAAIATAREVLDSAALQFAREFYSALIDGYPIEAALVEARKLLSVKGWDWSAYVLYASPDSPLLEFRVPSPG